MQLTLTHGTAVTRRMNDRGRSARQGRANDRVADDSAALARAHHTAVVFGRPLGSVVVQFVLVEAAGSLRNFIVVLSVEDVTGAE